MKSSTFSLALSPFVFCLSPLVVVASGVDMDDPRRALGREDDIRIDAQLLTDTVAPGSPIGVTYQIHNLTRTAVAVAEKRCEASYDPDSRLITVSIGAEVPVDGAMPRMAVIRPGEKKTFTAGAVVRMSAPSIRAPYAHGALAVQIKVNILRDLTPFEDVLRRQQQQPQAMNIPLSEVQFVQWLEGNDAIFLNPVPIQFSPARPNGGGADVGGRGGPDDSF